MSVEDTLSPKNSYLLSSLLCEERPITVDEACALRLLLFGNTSSTFGEEWTAQGFNFRANVSYGIIQRRAGPCGVLAAVQAYVLYEMLFGRSHISLDSGLLRPKLADKRQALSQALCSILWQAGEYKKVVYAVRRNAIILDNNITENVLKRDGLMEYLYLKYFKCQDDLLQFLYNYISEMMRNDSESCVLFLYSVILTHGIENIKKEMDVPESHLIGTDGYCSQVGQFYKTPQYPIWLLLGESHFTVLFATKKDILEKNKSRDSFQLFHYDGIKKSYNETKFVITPLGRLEETEKDKTENSILQCIYTRWPLASIEIENET